MKLRIKLVKGGNCIIMTMMVVENNFGPLLGKKGIISSLRNKSGISVSSVKSKLEIIIISLLEKHENLGKLGVDL